MGVNFGEQLGNLGKPLGTPWEHDEKKHKILTPQKEKN
jgi:hypothetical protein